MTDRYDSSSLFGCLVINTSVEHRIHGELSLERGWRNTDGGEGYGFGHANGSVAPRNYLNMEYTREGYGDYDFSEDGCDKGDGDADGWGDWDGEGNDGSSR